MDGVLSLADDDFALFGLPRRFCLDERALEARWKSLQAAAHPDRHASGTPADRRLAMQWAVRINEAYRRLEDPLARAAYLCRLNGIDAGADNAAMPQDFLVQQMTWREALAEAPGVGQVRALAEDAARARDEALQWLRQAIDGAAPVDWPAVAARVRQLMFIERHAADVDRRLDALQD